MSVVSRRAEAPYSVKILDGGVYRKGLKAENGVRQLARIINRSLSPRKLRIRVLDAVFVTVAVARVIEPPCQDLRNSLLAYARPEQGYDSLPGTPACEITLSTICENG